MKFKASLFAFAATGALVATGYSQTVIDITGSTAGRTAVDSQVKALLTGETTAYNGGASTANCNRGIYVGTYNGNSVIVRTLWTGSAAGVRDVSNAPQLDNQYLATNTTTSAGGTSIANGASLAPASAQTVSEIGFSDVFQTSTNFTANTFVQEDSVGVIPFKFFKNDGADAAFTNMTPGQFRYLYGALGEAPLSLFTGDAADVGTTVYATGRNNESGTRITGLAETGFGVNNNVNHYTGTPSGGVLTSITFQGNGGATSGGTLATLMAATYSGGILTTFLGPSDWAVAASGGATELTYNGVPYSEAAIQNGQYSFWGYLHQSSMTLTGLTSTFYDDLKEALLLTPGTGLILIEDMACERAADGAPISPL